MLVCVVFFRSLLIGRDAAAFVSEGPLDVLTSFMAFLASKYVQARAAGSHFFVLVRMAP